MKTFIFCATTETQKKFEALVDETKVILTLPATSLEAIEALSKNKYDVVFLSSDIGFIKDVVKNPPGTVILHGDHKSTNDKMLKELMHEHISSRVVEFEFNKESDSKFADFVKTLMY